MLTFVALDFETANTAPDSACEIGLVRIENGAVAMNRSWFVRPPTPEFFFTYLHGIDWATVKNAPTFAELMPELEPFFAGADFLAAHNAPFDRGVMAATCARYGLKPPSPPYLCTVQLARAVWNIYPTKLGDVCKALEIDLGRHHRASFDALACAGIVRKAVEKLGEAEFRERHLPKRRGGGRKA
jgi:DNA polymerase III subunit epsilon